MKRQPLLFYGWIIVGAALIWTLITYGTRFSFPVFLPALLDEFGWSRATTASILSINTIVYALTAPLAGVLVDRLGVRRLLILGAILVTLGMAATSQARQLWHFALAYGLLTASGHCLTGSIPMSIIVANWFTRRRGAALGIFLVGPAGAPVIGTLMEPIIRNMSWSAAYLVFAGLVAFIVLPLVIFIPRDKPQDMGLSPDGDTQNSESRIQSDERATRAILDRKWASTTWTLNKAVKTYRFWALFAIFAGSWGLVIMLTTSHLVTFLEDVGFSGMFAATTYGLYGVMFAAGNLCGFISDRVGREGAFTLGSIAAIVGIVALLFVRDTSGSWVPIFFAIAFGYGIGVTTPAGMAAVPDIFQGKHLGSIMGLLVFGFAAGASIGPWLGGWIHDITDSYTIAFILAIIAVGAGNVFIWAASPRKVRLVAGRGRPIPEAPVDSLEERE